MWHPERDQWFSEIDLMGPSVFYLSRESHNARNHPSCRHWITAPSTLGQQAEMPCGGRWQVPLQRQLEVLSFCGWMTLSWSADMRPQLEAFALPVVVKGIQHHKHGGEPVLRE